MSYMGGNVFKLTHKLTNIITALVKTPGFDFIGIKFIHARQSILRVYINSASGTHVSDCAAFSHQINNLLKLIGLILTKYNLEVFSPGIDHPIFTAAQYRDISFVR